MFYLQRKILEDGRVESREAFEARRKAAVTEPVRLIASKTDAEEADEIRAALKAPLEECAKIITEARAKGLVIQFNISADAFGRQVPAVTVVKPL